MTNIGTSRRVTRKDEITQGVLELATGTHGIGYWAGVSTNSRENEGGSYVELSIYELEDTNKVFVIGQDEIMKAVNHIVTNKILFRKTLGDRVEALLTARTMEDLSDELCNLDDSDGDDIVQVACYGKLVFG